MKKAILAIAFVFVFLSAVFAFAACNGVNGDIENGYEVSLTTAYALAEEKGYVGTYEEFIQAIKGDTGLGIKSIALASSNKNVDTYKITLTDNSTVDFSITNGLDGADGVGISAISEKSSSVVDGRNKMKYTVLYTNGETFDFYVTDGKDGATGERGYGITSIAKTNTQDNMDTYTITYANDEKTTFTITNGINGANGRSISAIAKTSSRGLIDTYTITYSDNTNSTFEISNGKDGDTPVLTVGKNGNRFVNDVDTGEKAQGETGKSAYQIYCENHPDYLRTEAEWAEDLATGKLRKVTITFDSNQGTQVSPVETTFGSYINVENPTRNGFDFDGWTLNDSPIDIGTYVFMADCTLVATWKDAKYLTVTYDAKDGVVGQGSQKIKYGEADTLASPSKYHQTFDGWYYGEVLISTTGTWDYTRNDITLEAAWSGSNIYMYLTVDSEYGECDESKATIRIGDRFTLPVPTSIKEGYSFTGWYLDTEKIADANGVSLGICTWTSSVTLRASYFIEIATIYDLMNLSGKSLNGNYLITNDLDFNGLGMNNIASIARGCVFDGGNHTIKNCVLSTDAVNTSQYGTPYSGFVKSLYGTICNLTIENMSCSEKYSSGLIGNMYYDSLIDNITIKDSFNDYSIRSVLVGSAWGTSKNVGNTSYRNTVYIKNVTIINSGNQAYTLGMYTQSPDKVSDSANTGKAWYYYPDIDIDGFYIEGLNNSIKKAGALFYYLGSYSTTASFSEKYYPQKTITITNVKINGNIENGIVGRVDNYYCMYSNVIVSRAEINGNTETAWSRVTALSDAILNGTTENWGASVSIRCVDTENEYELLSRNNITQSIVLFPDANGTYTYYTASGTANTFDDESSINKELFVSMLGFDDVVWDLDNIDVERGRYPTIK